MENKKKIRKNAPVQSSSSSDSSSSTSDSSADARKQKHRNIRKQRDSSSSSGEEVVRKLHKHQHKKTSSSSTQRKHSHSSKIRTKLLAVNAKKELRSISPTSRAAHKHHLKVKSSKKPKVIDEHDRHQVQQQRRDVIKDPEHRITSPTTRIRVSIPNNRVVQDRVSRSVKDTPSTSISRRVRETPDERSDHSVRQKEKKMRRLQEEEHYGKYMVKGERVSRISPEKHHQHERSRSRSHGRVPIRERLDKEYAYQGTLSRERDYSPMIRAGAGSTSRGNEPMSVERPFDYRSGVGDERRIPPHEYGGQSRMYDDRHHPRNWDDGRESDHPRGNRVYEGGIRDWDHSHDRKRGIDEPPSHYKDRQWNDGSHRADKEPKEWNRGVSNWKDQASHPSNQIAPTMSHPRRWPGPNGSDSWSPRVPHPSKLDHLSSGGPPFKPRGSYFGYKRFPFKRFPNQYSKINYSSKRVLPSSTETTSTVSNDSIKTEQVNAVEITNENDKIEVLESGEIPSELEEEKIAQQQQPDTTFSGNTEAAEECEGNLSEFSDVDDDILNREEIDENSAQMVDDESFASRTKSTSRAHNRLAYVNNRIFSPFSSDHYCIYGLLPRHADDVGKCARTAAENQRQQQANESSIEQQKQDEQDESAQKMIRKIHANKELKKEMDLDFEEISDGELEEESRNKGLGDALGVDWASLAKEYGQRPATKSTIDAYNMTRSRWSAHRILWDIGVSVKYAGEEFARSTLTEARTELKREKEDWLLKQKEQTNGDAKKEEIDGIEIKKEPVDESEAPQSVQGEEENNELEDFELDLDVIPHPLAQVQVLMRKLAIKRQHLILNSTSKYGRALSARKDLEMRRQLCNLPTNDSLLDRSACTNPEVAKNVDEIYRKLVEAEAAH